MKIRTLSLLAGLGTPLIMTTTAGAGFTGFTAVAKPNAFNLYVVNVYAEFDNPGADWFHKVGGTPGSPMNINVIGGEFYNHQFGSDQAPQSALVNAFPSLAYDSFYTIGRKVVDPPGGAWNALNLVNMPILAGTSVHTTNGSWGCVPPDAAQANPFDPVNSYPGDGRLLMGQFSVQIPDEGPYGITGEFLIGGVSDGQVVQTYVSFSSIVPAPGALGLLGLAGIATTRRRRR
jgi:hypothetical protein